MTPPLPRREFVTRVGRVAGAALIVGFDPRSRCWLTAADVGERPFENVPHLDGTLVQDEASLAAAADDRGHIIHLKPRAVLRPGSVRDIVRIVEYANTHRLKVAMRGQGHSHYGHCQVETGIVIDSSTLGRVGSVAVKGRWVDVEPGASWGAVADVTLGANLTPPVMPDVMLLTVGGTLSVGGLGATSQHFGAQVDNVHELDVVTGEGRLVTCSPHRERELFEMALAGLGQCGLIVRARLKLIPVQPAVSLWELSYDDLSTYLRVHERLVRQGRLAHQYGWVQRKDQGGWQYVIQLGRFDAIPSPVAPVINDLKLEFTSASRPAMLSHRAYLHRLDGFIANASRQPDWTHPRPSVTLFVPARAAEAFIARILRTADDTEGIWRFDVCPLLTQRFTRPLLRMPASDVAVSLWMFRTAPGQDAAALQRMLATVRSLLERTREVGGTPYSPYLMGSPDDWRTALGSSMWQRLAAAKRRYDPNGVLTPGPRMFRE